MKKIELLNRLEELLKQNQMHRLDGIGVNSTKASLENAIECMEASDSLLDEYFVVFKLKYPNSANAILNAGNWKTHYFNRLYVWNTARLILS